MEETKFLNGDTLKVDIYEELDAIVIDIQDGKYGLKIDATDKILEIVKDFNKK